MTQQRSDGLEAHALVHRLGGHGVAQLMGMDMSDAGLLRAAVAHPGDRVAVQGTALVGEEQPAHPAVWIGRPVPEHRHQLRVQRDVAVVVELADGDPQPVPVTDLDHGIGLEGAELAHAHAGAAQQLDDEAQQRPGLGPGNGHEPGERCVVQELGQCLVSLGEVAGEHERSGRCLLPVPFGDALEEHAQARQPSAHGGRGQSRSLAPRAPCHVGLVALDVAAFEADHARHLGVALGQEVSKLPHVAPDAAHALRPQRQGNLGQIVADREREGALGFSCRQDRHDSTARAWASMASLARRYSPASQSSAKCR